MGAPPLCYSLTVPISGQTAQGRAHRRAPSHFFHRRSKRSRSPRGPSRIKARAAPRDSTNPSSARGLVRMPHAACHSSRRKKTMSPATAAPTAHRSTAPRRRVLYHADHQAVALLGKVAELLHGGIHGFGPGDQSHGQHQGRPLPPGEGQLAAEKHHIAARRQVDAHVPLALHTVPDAPQGVPEAVEQPAPAAGGLPVRHPGRSCCWPAGPAPA